MKSPSPSKRKGIPVYVCVSAVLVALGIAVLGIVLVNNRGGGEDGRSSLNTAPSSITDPPAAEMMSTTCNCSLATGRYDLAMMGCGLEMEVSWWWSLYFVTMYPSYFYGFVQTDATTCQSLPTCEGYYYQRSFTEFSCERILSSAKPQDWFDEALFPNTEEYCAFKDAVAEWLEGNLNDHELYEVCVANSVKDRRSLQQQKVDVSVPLKENSAAAATFSTPIKESPLDTAVLVPSREDLARSSCNCSQATSRNDLVSMGCDMVVRGVDLMFFPMQTGTEIYRQVGNRSGVCEAIPSCGGTAKYIEFDCSLFLQGLPWRGSDWVNYIIAPDSEEFCLLRDEGDLQFWQEGEITDNEMYERCLRLYTDDRGDNRTRLL